MMSAVIGFGSALLAIVLTPMLQHYFWLTQRRAELCLAHIEDCAELVAEFAYRLPEILRSKNLTDEDRDLFLRWNRLSVEIHALFSEQTVKRFDKLDEIIDGCTGHYPSDPFKREDFLQAPFTAITALYEETGLTGNRSSAWWQLWRKLRSAAWRFFDGRPKSGMSSENRK
jgi:hypothetical protein